MAGGWERSWGVPVGRADKQQDPHRHPLGGEEGAEGGFGLAPQMRGGWGCLHVASLLCPTMLRKPFLNLFPWESEPAAAGARTREYSDFCDPKDWPRRPERSGEQVEQEPPPPAQALEP